MKYDENFEIVMKYVFESEGVFIANACIFLSMIL